MPILQNMQKEKRKYDNLRPCVNIFGAACSSPVTVEVKLTEYFKAVAPQMVDRIFMVTSSLSWKKPLSIMKDRTYCIFICPDMATFKKYQDNLVGRSAIAIVCDTPFVLTDIPGIIPLDFSPTGLSYHFVGKPLDVEKITATVKEKRPLNFDVQVYPLIQNLVQLFTHGRFLDKYNSLLMCEPSAVRRVEIQKLVFETFFTGKIGPLEKYLDDALKRKHAAKKDVFKKYCDQVLDFIDSEFGDKYILVMQGYKAGQKFEALCKQHDVDEFEIRYLVKSYQGLQKAVVQYDTYPQEIENEG